MMRLRDGFGAGRRGAAVAAMVLALLVPSTGLGGEQPPPLRIGLDYVPYWGPETTRIFTEEGFEADLAAELGRRLGRPVALETVPAGERADALADGRVEIVVGRQAAASSRRAPDLSPPPPTPPLPEGVAEVVETGFVSGLSVAMPTFTTVRRWEDLAEKTVCVSEANGRGQALARSLGAKVRVLRAAAQALIEVRTGQCDASIHDHAVLQPLLAADEWRKFSATLPETEPAALVVAVSRRDGALADAVETAVAAIRADGKWRRKEAQWASDVAFDVYLNQVGSDCH